MLLKSGYQKFHCAPDKLGRYCNLLPRSFVYRRQVSVHSSAPMIPHCSLNSLHLHKCLNEYVPNGQWYAFPITLFMVCKIIFNRSVKCPDDKYKTENGSKTNQLQYECVLGFNLDRQSPCWSLYMNQNSNTKSKAIKQRLMLAT